VTKCDKSDRNAVNVIKIARKVSHSIPKITYDQGTSKIDKVVHDKKAMNCG